MRWIIMCTNVYTCADKVFVYVCVVEWAGNVSSTAGPTFGLAESGSATKVNQYIHALNLGRQGGAATILDGQLQGLLTVKQPYLDPAPYKCLTCFGTNVQQVRICVGCGLVSLMSW